MYLIDYNHIGIYKLLLFVSIINKKVSIARLLEIIVTQ